MIEAEGSDPSQNLKQEESLTSTQLAQFFLLAVPLLSAPVAFYFNSQQAERYSLGLEFLIIGVLFMEFLLIVMINSDFFNFRGIYSKDRNEDRFEAIFVCLDCNEEMRFSIMGDVPVEIECYECGNRQEIQLNDAHDGIIHTDTLSP